MTAPQHPAERHPRPEFPAQDQPHPGWTGPMDPPPDHGEASFITAEIVNARGGTPLP
ncbi:short-chain dehydrogenase/reductase SDR [Streptomyces sp. NL15-2K]|nr:hypothetical protein [Kutzneria buriramensis]WKX14792.1 hypothetical protein Q4V64_47805 [Kutzneria buriramensis]GCB44108.1 short-chain dehydrogenase/reductase SDR [Streptomyces sp. NL15-2K]